ncbi:hypothetical protein, partial [Puniceibacterium sediminis]
MPKQDTVEPSEPKYKAAGQFLKHHVNLGYPGVTQQRILDKMVPYCGPNGPPNKSTLTKWYNGNSKISDDLLEALLLTLSETDHVRSLEGGAFALRICLTFLYEANNLKDWPEALGRYDTPPLVKIYFQEKDQPKAEPQSGSRDIQVGNVFELGSLVREGLPPVAPTLPLLDRAQIIDGGEPSLFNALS